ncbi:MAG: PAS domain S-box protein [Terriglobia bacterium]
MQKAQQNGAISILLLENDPTDAELCSTELRRAGVNFRAEFVQTPEEFHRKLDEQEYDLVLSDYGLSGWTGVDAFECLRAKHPRIPFILVTGAVGEEIAVECIKRGISDYVLKDRMARLPMSIKRTLEDKAHREEAERAEEEIRRLNEDLELRVAQRTAQLQAANSKLQIEVAERTRTEGILRESEQRFRLLVDGVRDYAIYMLDSQGRVVSWNAGAERIKGYRAEEIIGRNVGCFYVWEDVERKKPEADLATAAAEGRLESNAWRVKKDGSKFWANVVLTALRDPSGRLAGFSVVTRDITEPLRAQKSLEHLRLQREMILNSAGDGICGLDQNGFCTFANPAAARMLGWTPDDLTGKYLHGTLHPPAGDESRCAREQCQLELALKDGRTHRFADDLFSRKDGTSVTVSSVISPMYNDDGCIFGAVLGFHDMTEQRALERMKDEFISVVSHELRTPLTAIRGSLGLLASGRLCHNRSRCQKMAAVGVVNADRLVRLVNDILDLERIESGRVTMEKKLCDSADLMSAAVDLMRSPAEARGIALSVHPLSIPVWADPDRITQVLINLLSNATKFSKRGSQVTLSAERRDEKLLFTVTDRGRGIPASKLLSIFERFQQVDASDSREKGGTGLGLAICRTIVTQHGGEIWVESKLGCGSNFYFSLPLRSQEPKTGIGQNAQKNLSC